MKKSMDEKRWLAYQSIHRKIETQGGGDDKIADVSPLEQVENYKRYAELFQRFAPPQKFSRLLDVGAGNGAETKAFIEAGYEVVAIGFGIDNVEYAKKHFDVNILDLDMHDLSTKFKKESFDAAIVIHTFEHSISPFIFLGELYHVLVTGGKVLLDVPDFNNPAMRTIWHTNLLYPDQIEYYFNYWGFKKIFCFSGITRSQSKRQFIFEKRSPEDPDFKDNYGYLHWILDQLGQPKSYFRE